jgi:hypothetical protein
VFFSILFGERLDLHETAMRGRHIVHHTVSAEYFTAAMKFAVQSILHRISLIAFGADFHHFAYRLEDLSFVCVADSCCRLVLVETLFTVECTLTIIAKGFVSLLLLAVFSKTHLALLDATMFVTVIVTMITLVTPKTTIHEGSHGCTDIEVRI